MFNKFQKLFAILAVAGVFAFGVGCAEYDDDIANLQEQIDNLTGSTSADLASTVETLNSLIEAEKAAREASLAELTASVNSQVAAATNRITALETTAKTVQDNVAKLESNKADKSALAAEVAALQAEIDAKLEALGLDAYKAEVEARLTELEARLTELENSAATQDWLFELWNEVTDLKTSVALLNARVSNLEDCLSALEDYLEYNPEDPKFDPSNPDGRLEDIDSQLGQLMNYVVWEWNSYRNFQETWYGAKGEMGLGDKLTIFMNDRKSYDDKKLDELFKELNEGLAQAGLDLEEAMKEAEQNCKDKCNALEKALTAKLTELEKNLSGQIGGLKGLIEGVESQCKTLNTKLTEAQEALKKVQKEEIPALQEQIDDLNTVTDALAGRVDTIEGRLDDMDSAWADFIEEYSALVSQVDGLDAALTAQEQALAAHKKALEDFQAEVEETYATKAEQKAAAEKAAADLKKVDERLAAVEADYVKATDLTTKLADLTKTLEETMDSKIEDALADYTTSEDMATAIEDAIKTALGTAITDIATLRTEVDELNLFKAQAKAQLEALVARIQSLVFVPEYSDLKIHLNSQMLNGTQLNKATTTVTYRVTPASLAEELAALDKSVWAFYAHAVTATRSVDVETYAKAVTITGQPEYVKNGMIEFPIEVVADKLDPKTQDLAVALHLENPVTKEEEAKDVKHDYTTTYTTVDFGESVEVKDNFVLAVKDADDKWVEWDYATLHKDDKDKHTLRFNQDVWNETAGTGKKVELFENAEIVYKDGEEYLTLAEAKAEYGWIVDVTATLEHNEPTYPDGSALVDKTWTEDEHFFWLDEADAANVGQKFIDGVNVVVVAKGGQPYTNTTLYTDEVKITKDVRKLFLYLDFIWNYTIWNAGDAYAADAVLVDENGDAVTDLTTEQIAEIMGEWTAVNTDDHKDTVREDLQWFNDATTAVVELADAAETHTEKGSWVNVSLADLAYADHAKNADAAIVMTETVGEDDDDATTVTTLTLTVTFDVPEDRDIEINYTVENIALSTIYPVYFAYSGDALVGDNYRLSTQSFYDKEEVEKYFDGNADDARRMVRLYASTSKVVATGDAWTNETEGTVATATLKAYNPNGSAWSELAGEAWADDLKKAKAEVFTVEFTDTFDFNSKPEVVLSFADDTAVAEPKGNNGTEALGPKYPIIAKITVLNPTTPDGWVIGDRLSGKRGIMETLRKGTMFLGEYFDNYVNIRGSHNEDDHSYGYEVVNLWDALTWDNAAAETDDLYVKFNKVDDANAVTTEKAPEVDYDNGVANVTMKDLTYYYKNDDLTYNEAPYDAVLVSQDGNIIYRHYNADTEVSGGDNVRLFIEVPFDAPKQAKTFDVTLTERADYDYNLVNLLSMLNYVPATGDDDELIVGYDGKQDDGTYVQASVNTAGFDTNYTETTCYGLTIEWNPVFKAVDHVDNRAKLNATLDEFGNFHIDANDVTLQHVFEVEAEYTVKGNFGFEYTGTVTFTVNNANELPNN